MNFVRKVLEKLSDVLAGVLVFAAVTLALGYGLLLAVRDRWFKPDDAARKRSEAIQEALSEARRARAAELQSKLDAIDAAASADKKEDSVAAANRFVLDHWGKK